MLRASKRHCGRRTDASYTNVLAVTFPACLRTVQGLTGSTAARTVAAVRLSDENQCDVDEKKRTFAPHVRGRVPHVLPVRLAHPCDVRGSRSRSDGRRTEHVHRGASPACSLRGPRSVDNLAICDLQAGRNGLSTIRTCSSRGGGRLQ